MSYTIYDIETGPLPEAELIAMMPPFDPSEVKTGNIKDPDKIAAKLAESEAAYKREFIDRAALDPLTGRVLAIAVNRRVIGHDLEDNILAEFWDVCRMELGAGRRMVGFNTHLFDLPFLVRRSWRLRVPIPIAVRKGRYWSDLLIDLREVWQMGDRQAHGSLDSISRHLGVGQKNGDGKDFANLWATDRDKALAYIRNDIDLTTKVAAVLLGET